MMRCSDHRDGAGDRRKGAPISGLPEIGINICAGRVYLTASFPFIADTSRLELRSMDIAAGI
jgi:hypothetical protein